MLFFLKATPSGFIQLSFQMQLQMYEDMLFTKDANLQKVHPFPKTGDPPGLASSVQTLKKIAVCIIALFKDLMPLAWHAIVLYDLR